MRRDLTAAGPQARLLLGSCDEIAWEQVLRRLFAFARLQRCLEELLGRPVDLATAGALHHSLRQGILEEAVRAV